MTTPLEPMLATPWPEPFDDDDWWFEVKWDGYRAVVGRDGAETRARSRRGLDLIGRFPFLGSLELPDQVVLDGEVVAFDAEGIPSFGLLQQGGGHGLTYVVFDLLRMGGSMLEVPYTERRKALSDLRLGPPLLVPEPVRGSGSILYEDVVGRGFEGVVAKRAGSRYHPGRRSPDWRKISVRRRIRAVVGGFLPGKGGREGGIGSLLVGLHNPGGLDFVGAVGSGLDSRALDALATALGQIRRESSPFTNSRSIPGGAVWVEPGVVVVVEFKEWTRDRRLRAPVFKGVEMIDPGAVTWEAET